MQKPPPRESIRQQLFPQSKKCNLPVFTWFGEEERRRDEYYTTLVFNYLSVNETMPADGADSLIRCFGCTQTHFEKNFGGKKSGFVKCVTFSASPQGDF